METKKAWEFLLPPIPVFRPSHCPCARISNAASPRQVIIFTTLTIYLIIIYSKRWDIIHPRRRSVALPLCTVLSCEVRDHRMITSVNAFPIGLPYKRHHWPLDSIDVLTRPVTCDWLGRLQIYKLSTKLTNNFVEKLRKNTQSSQKLG